jgi:HD-GYP domain-containing protein (c-di-GMP phosphodiesterase class II)
VIPLATDAVTISIEEVYKHPSCLERNMLKALNNLCRDVDDTSVNTTIEHIVNEYAERVCIDSNINLCADTLKAYDESTYIHSVRVSILCLAIARILNYTKEAMAELGIAGLLHDIGKELVPVEIITKEDILTDIEMDIVKVHPAMSAYYLKEKYKYIDNQVLLGVYQHHERLDGSGYPRQLKGDEIGEAGRIIAIADVFEAYSSKRSYHQQRTLKETVDFIRSNKGLDQYIVEKFIQHIDFSTGTVTF